MSCEHERHKSCEFFVDSGIEYKTFDDGRITQATLYGVADNLESMLKRTMQNSKYFDYQYCTAMLPNSYIAKSKAHPHDIEIGAFNPDTGMDIAHDRVMEKYHKAFDTEFVNVLSDANQIVARLCHYASKKGIDISKVKSIDTWMDELAQK